MQKLKDIMSPDVQVISPDATIREAAEPMREGDFGMMPVGEDDRMIGAISDRDIAIRAVAEGKDPSTRVRDVMSEGVVWAYEDDSVEDAAAIMSEHQVRRLPIVNHEKCEPRKAACGNCGARGFCRRKLRHRARRQRAFADIKTILASLWTRTAPVL